MYPSYARSVLLWIAIACSAPEPADKGDGAAPDTAAPDSGAPDTGASDTGTPDDGCEPAAGAVERDAWGGDLRASLEATGAFRVQELCGRWWLVTPDGHPMASQGVNTTQPAGSTDQLTGENLYAQTVDALYESDEAWALATAERLRSWGFDTAGSWSATDLLLPVMPVTVNLDLSGDDWESGAIADYFDPAWVAQVQEKVAAGVRPKDPKLVGYFIDNEVHWGPDWRSLDTLLLAYLSLDAAAPGKQEAVRWLLEQVGSAEAVDALAGTAHGDEAALLAATSGWEAFGWQATGDARTLVDGFLGHAAAQYFAVTVGAIRAADPAHLVLGNREVSVMTPAPVYQAQAALVDVVSVNRYTYVEGLEQAALTLSGGLDPGADLASVHALTGRPVLVTEFGFRADDSGLPNSWPPVYPTYDTQEERADAYEAQVGAWQAAPWIIGWHWYRWVDDPENGRFDGEDNNWGLVSELDQPYEVLVERTAAVNARTADALRVPVQ